MKKILSLIVIYFLLTGISWGDMGHSQEGKGAEVTLTHTSALDSAWVIFSCNGSRYDSIKIIPIFGSSSRFLAGTDLDLDSLCEHSTEIRMYSGGNWTDTLTGAWLHENPNLTVSDSVTIDRSNAYGLEVDMVKISADATAANNAELFFDGTGYAGTNNVIPTVTTTTNLTTNNDKAGYKLAADGLDADTSFDQVQGKVDALPSDPADDSDIDGQLATIMGDLVSVVLYTDGDGSDGIDAEVAAIKTKTDKLTFNAQDSLIADYSNMPSGATDTTLIKAVANNNPQIWTDQSSGAGTEQETLIVLNGDDNAVEGAKISIWNSSGTPYANNITDANGKHVFYLDVGTYVIGTRRVGIHSSTDTLEITADGTDTITVVAHTPPGAPGSDSVCIEGFVYNLGYVYPTAGLEVIFYLGYETAIQDTSTGVFLEKVPVSVAVDDTGYFKTYLPASINLVNWSDYIAGDSDSADTIFYIVEIKKDTRVVLPPIEGVFIIDSTGCLNIEDIPFR